MTPEQKLKELIEDELETLFSINPRLRFEYATDRDIMARHLADALFEPRPSYRSGRRISDRLRDTLINIQKWWIRRA